MDKESIWIGRFKIFNSEKGRIINHRTISEFSVSVDRKIINDRTNARYLIEDNIRDGVRFDLKIGKESFIDKSITLNNEPCLLHLFNWAISQKGDTIKKVFNDADIASCRGTLARIAKSPICGTSKGDWAIAVQKIDDVIFISELSKVYTNDTNTYGTYSGCKFEQYMTTDEPNGHPNTVLPVDNHPTFEIMVRSDLEVGEESIKLCCLAEIDALSGDELVEMKTCNEEIENLFFWNLSTILQSEIVGVNRIIIGRKDRNFIVEQVFEKSVDDMKNDFEKDVKECYSFLFTVLSKIKKFLIDNEACKVTFDSNKKVVNFIGISRHEADVDFGKENGQFIREKLQKHFINRIG